MVDFLGASLVDWRTRDGRDLLRKALAIEPDERRELFAISGQAGLLESTEPGGDPGLYRIDEGSVEVEEHGGRQGKSIEGGRHRLTVAPLWQRRRAVRRIRFMVRRASALRSPPGSSGGPTVGGWARVDLSARRWRSLSDVWHVGRTKPGPGTSVAV